MMQLVVFILVLAVVFAVKAVAISRTHEELAQDSATFSWMGAHAEDEAKAASWAVEEEGTRAGEHRPVAGVRGRLRHVGA